MEELQIQFIGVEDDGLASRHSGQTGKIIGNALEALELFAMALQMNHKYLASSVSIMTRIIDTGDVDMIKVPFRTSIKVMLDGNCMGDMKKVLKRITVMAEGAALMAGCITIIEKNK